MKAPSWLYWNRFNVAIYTLAVCIGFGFGLFVGVLLDG